MAIYDRFKLASSPPFHIGIMEEKSINLRLEKAKHLNKTCLTGQVFCDCIKVPYATVTVFNFNFKPLCHTTTNCDGVYVFKNVLSQGIYLVMASSMHCITSKEKLVILENYHVSKINLYLKENPSAGNSSIYGVVRDSFEETPLANVCIKLKKTGSQKLYAVTYTNEFGEYIFSDIKPNDYALKACHKSYLRYYSHNIHLDKGMRAKLDISLIYTNHSFFLS